MSTPKRWQEDKPFIKAMIARQYVFLDDKGRPKPHGHDGVMIYMWEAWRDGIKYTLEEVDNILGPTSANDVREEVGHE